jgi:hypothetical protein
MLSIMSEVNPEVTFESSDAAIQADVSSAWVLANQANYAFNDRKEAALLLSNLIEGELSTFASAERVSAAESMHEADERFNKFKFAAEVLMPPIAAFETAAPTGPFAEKSVWRAMSREQKVKAAAVRSAIAESPLKEQGVTEETLRVVKIEKDGENHFTLIHTGAGVDIGNHGKDYDKARSYKAVMSDKNDKLFQVEVDGVTYDTRKGMTDEVYIAKVEDARARGVTLPDSKPLSKETGDLWTWTMLTGEPLTADGDVQFRGVDEGQVNRYIVFPDYDRRDLRVCPAVVI